MKMLLKSYFWGYKYYSFFVVLQDVVQCIFGSLKSLDKYINGLCIVGHNTNDAAIVLEWYIIYIATNPYILFKFTDIHAYIRSLLVA